MFVLLVKYSLKNDTNYTNNGEYVTNKSSEIRRSQVVYVKCKEWVESLYCNLQVLFLLFLKDDDIYLIKVTIIPLYQFNKIEFIAGWCIMFPGLCIWSSPCVTSIFRIEIDTMFQAYIADTKNVLNLLLTLSWRRPLSYRNQSIDLLRESVDWLLYDNGLRHERVKWQ